MSLASTSSTLTLVFALQACDRPAQLSLGADPCQTSGLDEFALSALGPTDRSHWLQPWRAYQDTWPAERMRGAVGMSLNDQAVNKHFVSVMARSGVRRAVVVVQWAAARFDDPTKLTNEASEKLIAQLRSLQESGMRPLIVVYGFEGTPTPNDPLELKLIAPAAAGARTVNVDPAQVADIVPGHTGLSQLTGYIAAEILITHVTPQGVATLSKPLTKALEVGVSAATTLKFVPFSQPVLPEGSPNPAFERTVGGWISFVKAVALQAKDVLGSSAFDIELWNETVTGSKFLDINNYYDPPLEAPIENRQVQIEREILRRTTLELRQPSLATQAMGIGNGFANTNWSYAASTEPPGTTGLDRHVSVSSTTYPNDAVLLNSRTLDALGEPDGMRLASGAWADGFTPAYTVLFPELPLTAVLPYDSRRPGQLIRDLAPLSTFDINGVTHGRNERPVQSPFAPEVWITAISTSPRLMPNGIDAPSEDELWRFKAKTTLRTLASYVSKGAALVSFYAPEDRLALIDYAAPDGGRVMSALARFTSAFAGPPLFTHARSLKFVAVRGCEASVMVAGDQTPAHPGQTDRDLVAFFPFQTNDKEFVAATYIMTRDLMEVYQAAGNRFDLPPRPFDLVVDGFDASNTLVQGIDPLDGRAVEITVKSRVKSRLVISVPLTDSVTLLRFSEP